MPSEDLIERPEFERALKLALPTMIAESDRGAVTIAADMVTSHLQELLVLVARPGTPPPNPRTMKGKADRARTVIGERTYAAIDALRNLRNKVAHSTDPFALSAHRSQVEAMFDIGDHVPMAIQNTAARLLVVMIVGSVWEGREELERELGRPAFNSPNDVIDTLRSMPEAMDILDKKLPRLELALGVSLLCTFILWQATHATPQASARSKATKSSSAKRKGRS